ncbi:hypothetical protein ACTNDQ_14405, partial [Blautia massiliensis (ex Liu et al. 2021)]
WVRDIESSSLFSLLYMNSLRIRCQLYLYNISNELTEDDLKDILCEIKREDISRVTFKTEQLKKYFPKDYTVEKMKREIIDILKIWMDKYWDL